jgi:hypothetical protein
MYGNPCLRTARKSRSGERVRPGVGVFRVELVDGKRLMPLLKSAHCCRRSLPSILKPLTRGRAARKWCF